MRFSDERIVGYESLTTQSRSYSRAWVQQRLDAAPRPRDYRRLCRRATIGWQLHSFRPPSKRYVARFARTPGRYIPMTRFKDAVRPSTAGRCLVLGLVLVASAATAAVKVEIEGLTPELERNVRAHLSIDDAEPAARAEQEKTTETPDPLVEERRIRRLHAAAPGEISAGLEPFGYYDSRVDGSLEQKNGDWIARYTVDLGLPVTLTVVDIEARGEGSELPAVRDALAAITLAPGQALNHVRYQAARQSLYDAAYNAGFIDANYTRAELLVSRGARTAEVHLTLDTGPRYYFGAIDVQQEILDPVFVSRFVTIKPGDPFDTNRLVALQLVLNDSGYFNDVNIDVARERIENQRIPVTIRLTPRLRQEYTLGLGYGTNTGARIHLGVGLRRIGNKGHRFQSDLRLSNIQQTAAAEYRIPKRNVATDFLSFRSSLGSERIGDWDTHRFSLGAAWQDDWRDFRRQFYLTAQREKFGTELTESDYGSVLYIGGQLSAKRADDPLVPRTGHSWSVDVRAGTNALPDATGFLRVHADAKLVRSFGDRLRLLMRAEYGALRAPNFDRLIPSQRFYAGGDGSVRGYAYEDLSPRDANGASIGGRYLFVASAELEFNIVGNYGAALFVDAGNAANELLPKLKRGAGIGMRWRSPVGVVGIDIANPVDDPDRSYRIHLSIGADL